MVSVKQFGVLCALSTNGILGPYFEVDERRNGVTVNRVRSVSYTHLDVYKRQRLAVENQENELSVD